jgi:hypothetical protein
VELFLTLAMPSFGYKGARSPLISKFGDDLGPPGRESPAGTFIQLLPVGRGKFSFHPIRHFELSLAADNVLTKFEVPAQPIILPGRFNKDQ